MASITIHDSVSFQREDLSGPVHVIVVLDSPNLLPSLEEAEVRKILALGQESDFKTLQAVAANLSQASDAATKADCHFSAEKEVLRYSVVLLPAACSRHNTPSRSHALAAAVRDIKSSKNTIVLLLVENEQVAFAQGLAVGRQFPVFSKKSNDHHGDSQQVAVVLHFPASHVVSDKETLLRRMFLTVNNIRLAQRLVDTPPNLLHSDAYVADCLELANMLNCSAKVIKGHELEAQGFGGLWSVGQAAHHLPALVILSYTPPSATTASSSESVCLVGKGIIYDTGGLSLKTPGANMVGMKTDMGGSAAVLGAFLTAVADGGLQRPLHALLCLAENSVGPLSTRPDDIITMLSGKTVEVNNTDAEGRLVLSDGVYYASKHLQPAVIIDIATLTGAQLIATGKKHAAIYSSHEDLENLALTAGKYTGDLTFPVPFAPELFRQEFRSTVADMKNSVADRGNAQTSCAGQFIGNHLEEYLNTGKRWLHVDMAGPCTVGDRATGYGVALLFDLVLRLQTQSF
eukprot:gene4816-5280_t